MLQNIIHTRGTTVLRAPLPSHRFVNSLRARGGHIGRDRDTTLPKAGTDIPNEVLDTAELGFGDAKQCPVKLDLLKGQVQEVLDLSLLLGENVTYSPCVLKKLLWFVPSIRRWSISHIIVDLQSDCELYAGIG